MRLQKLKKSNVKPLCIVVSLAWETYIPLEDFAGEVQFMRLDSTTNKSNFDNIKLDYEFLTVPPKTILFPQLESLFKFEAEKIIETVKPARKSLFFGLRACDLKGILFMDDFFKRNFKDVYYLNRSQEKLLVLVGCTRPLENCFCTSIKTGPFLEEGFDLQLTDLGAEYLVEVGSKKGAAFVRDYKKFFLSATGGDLEEAKIVKLKTAESVSLKLDFDKALKKFCQDDVSGKIYERIAQRCIYCGGCLYVCPTCTCFNVFDEGSQLSGKRWRNWDACVFAGYTREASGHNPRLEKQIRTRRRYEHKLKYDYLSTGMSSCVGCGRCLAACPVNIGISQVIEEVARD